MIKIPAPIIIKLNKIVITLFLSFDNKNVPARPPINVPIDTGHNTDTLSSPLKKYTTLDTTQIGNIISTAVAWAIFGFCLKINLNKGTTSMPPPAPKNPFTKPTTVPAQIAPKTCFLVNFFFISKNYYFQITKTYFANFKKLLSYLWLTYF